MLSRKYLLYPLKHPQNVIRGELIIIVIITNLEQSLDFLLIYHSGQEHRGNKEVLHINKVLPLSTANLDPT